MERSIESRFGPQLREVAAYSPTICEGSDPIRLATEDDLATLFDRDRREWHLLVRFAAYRLQTQNTADAEDIIQDAYERVLRAIRARPTRIEQSGLWKYCRAVVYNLVNDHFASRKHYGQETEPAELDKEEDFGGRNPAQLRVAVERVLRGLSPTQRTVIELTVHGFSDTEIAKQVGVKVNNVKQLRHRARERLTQELSEAQGHIR